MKTTKAIELVSIITPTHGRPQCMEQMWKVVHAQTWPNIEWLVGDDSPTPSQFMQNLENTEVRKVRYLYDGTVRRTIGQKRNDLIATAKGEYIVHFDDDDYYSPHYIEYMLSCISDYDVEICKLSSFFLLYKDACSGAYWDLLIKQGVHFRNGEANLIPIAVTNENNYQLRDIHWGFGFSYVYKRSVWEHHKYQNINMHEDTNFMREAVTSARIKLIPDTKGLCIHTIHGSNTSQCFPQSVFPVFMLGLIVPGAESFISFEMQAAVSV